MNNKTKIKALMNQIESGKIKTDSCRILNYIIKNRFTSRPLIADGLGMKLQTVVARVSDLLDMGIIEVVETDNKPFGSGLFETVDDYEILTHQTNALGQVKNATERRRAKFNQWKKRGVKEFSDFLQLEQIELQFD